MDKIHIWLGMTSKSKQEYWDYFYKSTNNSLSQFCIDTKLKWLDEDFIGYYFNEHSDDLKTAISNSPESGLYETIFNDCKKKGINKANAMFYYTGDNLTIGDPSKKFNDLTYIGVYDWN